MAFGEINARGHGLHFPAQGAHNSFPHPSMPLACDALQEDLFFQYFLPDIFQIFTRCLQVKDLFTCAAVSKTWSRLYRDPAWCSLSEEMDIPLVEGEGRDRRSDFRMLHKTAGVSRKIISQYLGKIVGN